ncbi:MAG: hypothetical protein JXR48_02740 [Candidatus Delongbacteria bacterium]|nr:hypothetical protein [Candidatus Delongbacteria bacterium]MBN2833864.1 hypothetical protein [Candidatus Delongbacteria bacterium]
MKSIKKTVTMMLMLILSVSYASETIEFDIGKYKPVNYKRHSLDLSTVLDNHFYGDNWSDYNNETLISKFNDENSSKNVRFGLNQDYFYTNRMLFDRVNFGIESDLGYQYQTGESEDENLFENELMSGETKINNDSSLSRFSFSGEIYGSYRNYFLSDDFFGEFSIKSNVMMNIRNNESNSTEDKYEKRYYSDLRNKLSSVVTDENSDLHNYDFNISPEIAIGYGDIDQVGEAKTAVDFFQDLSERGCLSRNPTDDEILNLSGLITELKNKRFFDSRDKRIEDITEIDSYLKKIGILKNEGASYFTTLNDVWSYSNKSRKSGLEVKIGVNPNFSIYNNDYSYETIEKGSSNEEYFNDIYLLGTLNQQSESENDIDKKSDGYSNGVLGLVGFNYSKPISLKLQFDFESILKYGFSKRVVNIDEEEYYISKMNEVYIQDSTTTVTNQEYSYSDTHKTEQTFDLEQIEGSMKIDLNYYLNSRTSFGVSIGLDYSKISGDVEYDETSTNFDSEILSLKTSYDYVSEKLRIPLSLSSKYYFSPQVILSAKFTNTYSFSKLKDCDINNITEYEMKPYLKQDEKSNNYTYSLSLSYAIF